jgi:acetyltransferase-like isoleucine patch superfamily enzyme
MRQRLRNSWFNIAREFIQSQVRRHYWTMDIHPSARVAVSAYIDRTWPQGVHIGPGSIIDEDAVVLTHDLTRGLYLDTTIGAACVIGARAIVLPGITIGDNAVIMPGSVVTRDVPSGATVMGNPARLQLSSSIG